MNKYDPKWTEEMMLKNPDIPVIKIDYEEFKNMDIKLIPGKDFVPGKKKSPSAHRNSPFADSYSPRPKL